MRVELTVVAQKVTQTHLLLIFLWRYRARDIIRLGTSGLYVALIDQDGADRRHEAVRK